MNGGGKIQLVGSNFELNASNSFNQMSDMWLIHQSIIDLFSITYNHLKMQQSRHTLCYKVSIKKNTQTTCIYDY